MEYFGYKPKDLDKSYIDWSGITKGISDEITSTLVNRQQQRDQLEKDHFERLKKLNDFNLSVDPSASSSVLKGVQNARDYLMSNHRLMKSGAISVDEAKRRSQNLMDSWTFLSKGMETYVAGAEKRAESEGKLNDAYNEIIPGYFDLANSGQVPEPGSGEGYTVPYNPDGTLNMDRAIPNRAMLNLGSQVAEFVDVEAATTAIADDAKTGVWKQSFADGTSITDARQNPNYKSWITNTVNSNLNTDEKLASVLLDYKGMEYTTTNEPGKIQIEFDRKTGKIVPKLTDEQRKDARHEFRHSIEAKIGATRTEQQLTKDERSMKDLAGLAEDYITTGNKSSLDALLMATNHVGAESTDDGLILKGSDGIRTAVNFKQGMDGKQLARELATKAGVTMYDRFGTKKELGVNEGVFNPSMYTDIVTQAPKDTELDFKQMSTLDKGLESNLYNVLPGGAKSPKTGGELESALKENYQTMTGYLSQDGFDKVFEYKDGNIFYDGIDLGSANQNLTSLALKIKGSKQQGGTTSQVITPAPRF